MKIIWDSRRNGFDFLRLFLSISVIFSHCWPLTQGTQLREPLSYLTGGQTSIGAVAVNLFFIMSGFLITASAVRSSTVLEYLRKRVARIYPAFIVVSMLGFFLVTRLAGEDWAVSPLHKARNLILNVLILGAFHTDGAFRDNPYPLALNGSLWTIQYEFICYIAVALLLVSGMLTKRTAMLVLFVGVWLTSCFWFIRRGGEYDQGLASNWFRLAPCYLAGAVFYLYRERIKASGRYAVLALLCFIPASLVPFGWNVIFPIAGSYLVFVVAFQQRFPLPDLARFGDFSYGTYLYAFPIQQLLVSYFSSLRSPLRLFVAATPLTLLFAMLSWYLVERKFLRTANKKEEIPLRMAA